eukprot:2301887-Amphidinium_carterae.2
MRLVSCRQHLMRKQRLQWHAPNRSDEKDDAGGRVPSIDQLLHWNDPAIWIAKHAQPSAPHLGAKPNGWNAAFARGALL